MSNDFRLTYELEQHTPLIHFQHDQAGATLRASEVKPKLDKFILKKLGGFDKVWETNKDWFVGVTEKTKKEEVKPALNYKLRFLCEDVRVYDVPKYSIYYGNMGNGANKAMFVTGKTKATVLCFIPELAECIKKYIGEFFICTNFGRMQGKGFGSFTVKGMSIGNVYQTLAEYCGAKACYSFCSNDTSNPVREDTFKEIKSLYSVIKSGTNFGVYTRSLLFRYFYDKSTGDKVSVGNEKRYMKNMGISPNVKKSTTYISPSPVVSQYKYTRALLGVGERIEYIAGLDSYDKPKKGARGIEKEVVSISNDDIERFSSPILFKVIGDTVYIVAKRIDSVIYGKAFTFKNEKTGNSDKIVTPSATQFDIDEFMDYVYNNYKGKIRLQRRV
ncbi:MAG: hypothetical protein K5664_07385 [Firmicutes bacterium]|nr:hypothetical protein [Bacillota bacterium]